MLLRERVQKLDESQKSIAKVAGVSDATISRFLKGDQLGFYPALKIIKKYWPDHEKEIILNFCSHLRLKNERSALEYLLINGDIPLAESTIVTLNNSKNRHDKKWASLYNIEILRNKGHINPSELLELVEKSPTETLEMKIYSTILKSYAYFETQEFDIARSLLVEIEKKLHLISDDYIRKMYSIRVRQVLSQISLQKNDVVNARRYNESITAFDDDSTLIASAYHTLGNSYIFESYDRALENLQIARNMYKSRNRTKAMRNVENSINFLQNLHYKKPEYLCVSDEKTDIHANAFYLIRSGKLSKATEILNKVNINNLNNFSKGFHFFYRAEISKDENTYLDSIDYFKESGDAFYRTLPLQGLKELGYSQRLLKTLAL